MTSRPESKSTDGPVAGSLRHSLRSDRMTGHWLVDDEQLLGEEEEGDERNGGERKMGSHG